MKSEVRSTRPAKLSQVRIHPLRKGHSPRRTAGSRLARVREAVRASQDVREADGNLSAARVAKLFGLSLAELSSLLGRSRQAVWKAPAAESLQGGLAFFERIARLRLALGDERDFLLWLKTSNPALASDTPLERIRRKRFQEVAELVEDILAGNPN